MGSPILVTVDTKLSTKMNTYKRCLPRVAVQEGFTEEIQAEGHGLTGRGGIFLCKSSEDGFTESMMVSWFLNDESTEKREDITGRMKGIRESMLW